MANVTVVIKGFDKEAIKRDIYKNDAAGKYLAQAVARYSDEFVPYKDGPLSQTYEIEPFKLTYTRVYSNFQWNGVFNGKPLNYTKTFHPKATDHWVEKAMDEKMDLVVRDFSNYLKGR